MHNLNDREWKPFFFFFIFDEVERGKRLKKNDHIDGIRPYVSSSAKNNGVDQFIGNTEKIRCFSNCLSLANSGSVGSCFYEPFEFVASDHVTHLKKDGVSQYIYLFMATTVNRISEKYDFNREINDYRISREKIMLPVTDDGEPDYQFMEDYMKELMTKKRKQYMTYVDAKITRICGEGGYQTLNNVVDASECEWKPISIVSLFTKFEAGKCSNVTELKKGEGECNIPYIGATNNSNGLLFYLPENEIINAKIQKGNCIGFIKDGDGSAGYAIYKKENFVSTVNVIYGYADWLNQYTGLFFVAAQDLIERKYSHGYKRNQQHLRGDKVMLPVTNDGEPDYAFMEQYGRKMMVDKYMQYLKYAQNR